MLLHLTLLHDSLQVPIVSDDQCRSQTNLTIASFMLCAGGNGAGPCKVREGGLSCDPYPPKFLSRVTVEVL